jgi:sulfite reductase beta subunit-like hemoprotein
MASFAELMTNIAQSRAAGTLVTAGSFAVNPILGAANLVRNVTSPNASVTSALAISNALQQTAAAANAAAANAMNPSLPPNYATSIASRPGVQVGVPQSMATGLPTAGTSIDASIPIGGSISFGTESKTGLFLGIAAAVAVVLGGFAFVRSSKRRR